MAGEYLTAELMRGVVSGSISDFARRDMELLHIGVQEETLAHRLAIYIEQRLTGWQVDCEYNRNLQYPKMSHDGLSRMRPDIIAHIRNSPRNLLVVEIKKTTHSKRQRCEAVRRVRDFTGKWTTHPRYCHGVVIVFPVRPCDPMAVECEWFHRDGCTANTGGEPKTKSERVSLIVKP